MKKRLFITADRIPDRKVLMLLNLEALVKLGGEAHGEDIDNKIVEIEKLTKREVEIPHQGKVPKTKFRYNSAWARTYLHKGKAIRSTKWGFWEITKFGRENIHLETMVSIYQKVTNTKNKKHKTRNPKGGTQFENNEENKTESAVNKSSKIGSSESTLYSLESIKDDGCFLDDDKLNLIFKRLSERKNLILQGPPGTGKTWLAKKMAYALIGKIDTSQVRIVQFHPNLSYEDFIKGWRPDGEGSLKLVDGPFMEMINTAKKDPNFKYVFVIEEINRGNPAHIFGEMLTLLETDKRNIDEAMELTYMRSDDVHVYVPDNLYVIGTMNVADRSIAMVDYALRRRFAFIDLVPTFNDTWKGWVHDKYGIETQFLDEIARRMDELNEKIESDSSLGAQFKLGHSYVTPSGVSEIEDTREWFNNVVETEIGPILTEYWFEDLKRSKEIIDKLRFS